MDYKKDKRIKRKRIIAPQPTNTDKMPLIIGLKIQANQSPYKPNAPRGHPKQH